MRRLADFCRRNPDLAAAWLLVILEAALYAMRARDAAGSADPPA